MLSTSASPRRKSSGKESLSALARQPGKENGDAWDYFTHDQARSRAITGARMVWRVCDDQQRLCFALALWNGRDPILKERLFGLTNSEGNHGEDVKEYYFYLDSTPTHSYMKYLYKYPQEAYPYGDLIETNRRRGRSDMEYELLDTGRLQRRSLLRCLRRIRKGGAERHPDPDQRLQSRAGDGHAACAADAVVSQHLDMVAGASPKPSFEQTAGSNGRRCDRGVACRARRAFLVLRRRRRRCCSPKTRPTTSGSSARPTPAPYVKDGINNYVVHGRQDAVNPEQTGTKAAAHYQLDCGRRGDRRRSGCG